MRYMLDTKFCIDLARAGSTRMLSRMRTFAADELVISCITLAELQHGVAKTKRPEHHQSLLARFCAPLAVVSFDHRAPDRRPCARP